MLTIAWDVDDVLNDLMRVWLERVWLPTHPGRRIAYEDLRANPPHSVIGSTLGEYLASLDEFRLSRYSAELAAAPEALAWFEQHGERYRHVALTSVPLRCAPVSAAWVTRNFGRWIRTFHFVPSKRADDQIPAYDETKRDFLRWWGKADVLVDDQPGHVASARALGLRAWLVPRPWNAGTGRAQDVFRELGKL
jgi:5'(3')-deoxyribonucleotidase